MIFQLEKLLIIKPHFEPLIQSHSQFQSQILQRIQQSMRNQC